MNTYRVIRAGGIQSDVEADRMTVNADGSLLFFTVTHDEPDEDGEVYPVTELISTLAAGQWKGAVKLTEPQAQSIPTREQLREELREVLRVYEGGPTVLPLTNDDVIEQIMAVFE